ncbi:MAG: prepilin-type N-terminal cleavage/methylation domain-containing protein [Planctomycetota bacterium]|nr:MAG: prepilin-type N-terminal cleavage/methylation domain-containing protein [Planctomycetota bacterium]
MGSVQSGKPFKRLMPLIWRPALQGTSFAPPWRLWKSPTCPVLGVSTIVPMPASPRLLSCKSAACRPVSRGNQAGFTLVEMLVASAIFIVGFVSVYGLFLTGVKYRSEADIITRSAVAASNVVNELRLGILPLEETEVGDGPGFRRYRDQPGLFYQIHQSQGLPNSAARKVSMRFVHLPIPQFEVSNDVVQRRFRRAGDPTEGPSIEDLVQRGIIMSYPAVIYPR